ncbi:MAG0490 family ComEA-like DNA-binding protein [Mycoplasmopsis cynos]
METIFYIFIYVRNGGTIFLIDKYKTMNIKKINPDEKNDIHYYKISGAAKHIGVHKSLKKLTYRELFFIAKVSENANIEIFKLNNYVPENSEVVVPYKNYKLKWIYFENINQLSKLGISKKILISLLKHRREKIKT